MGRRCAIIAGGGTGGHIYPGISIAREAQKMDPTIEIHFIGSKLGLEKEIVPKNGFPLHFISISGLAGMKLKTKIKTLLLLPLSLGQSVYWILKLDPVFVLGVGGYSSGPVVLAASLLRRNTAIWEANAHPGLANRWLSSFVNRVFLVFEESKKYLPGATAICLGLPVRENMVVHKRATSEKLRVLVFGGSQGAKGINQAVTDAFKIGVEKKEAWLDQVEVFHQTGKADFEAVNKLYSSVSSVHHFRATPYIDEMNLAYANADLVFCRSGASTIAELAVCGKAAVLIPFPFAADNHQQKNAEHLVSQGAALMYRQDQFSGEKFIETIRQFMNDRTEIPKLEAQIQHFHRPGAGRNIVKYLLGIQGKI